jgi:hypothetical protein
MNTRIAAPILAFSCWFLAIGNFNSLYKTQKLWFKVVPQSGCLIVRSQLAPMPLKASS